MLDGLCVASRKAPAISVVPYPQGAHRPSPEGCQALVHAARAKALGRITA
jgi:hypothetical protein